MKMKKIMVALLLATITISGTSFAQIYGVRTFELGGLEARVTLTSIRDFVSLVAGLSVPVVSSLMPRWLLGPIGFAVVAGAMALPLHSVSLIQISVVLRTIGIQIGNGATQSHLADTGLSFGYLTALWNLIDMFAEIPLRIVVRPDPAWLGVAIGASTTSAVCSLYLTTRPWGNSPARLWLAYALLGVSPSVRRSIFRFALGHRKTSFSWSVLGHSLALMCSGVAVFGLIDASMEASATLVGLKPEQSGLLYAALMAGQMIFHAAYVFGRFPALTISGSGIIMLISGSAFVTARVESNLLWTVVTLTLLGGSYAISTLVSTDSISATLASRSRSWVVACQAISFGAAVAIRTMSIPLGINAALILACVITPVVSASVASTSRRR